MPSQPLCFVQASRTKTSLTAVTTTASTPLALISSTLATKPGMWLRWQVGVKAPGTAKRTTRRPLNISSVVFSAGRPSVPIVRKVLCGRRSPT